ncbi:MAG: hypothetical protein ACRBB4_05040 [Neptuniibacter sp.]
MLKTQISPATNKPVSRLCLNVGAECVALVKAVADVQHLTPEQCFEQAFRPYVLALVEELSVRPDAQVEFLEEIEHAINEMLGSRKVAA